MDGLDAEIPEDRRREIAQGVIDDDPGHPTSVTQIQVLAERGEF